MTAFCPESAKTPSLRRNMPTRLRTADLHLIVGVGVSCDGVDGEGEGEGKGESAAHWCRPDGKIMVP